MSDASWRGTSDHFVKIGRLLERIDNELLTVRAHGIHSDDQARWAVVTALRAARALARELDHLEYSVREKEPAAKIVKVAG